MSSYKIQHVPVKGWRTVHELKCWEQQFRAVADGSKPFELRKDDRQFKSGDILWLRETDDGSREGMPGDGAYTGRSLYCIVRLILSKFAPEAFNVIAPGYVVMGLGKRSSVIDTEPFNVMGLPSLTLAFALDIDAAELAESPLSESA